jgi:divalent metal cation (Fe/Co/Zn/Cd) transporter
LLLPDALLELTLLSTQFQYVEESSSPYQKQIALLQLITILWMCVEAAMAIFAALRAHSVALLGFGADSGIELASAVIVLLRFKRVSRISETKAARITGLLLFALAAFILGSSILTFINPRFRPEPSYLGIALLIAAAIVMPWLAARKRELAVRASSSSLRADATQNSVCGYLAWIALAGLVLNAAFHLAWADSLAALGLLPFVLKEAMEAQRGNSCICH